MWILPAICLSLLPFWLDGCDWRTQNDIALVVGSKRVTMDQLRKDLDFLTAGIRDIDSGPNLTQNGLLDQIIDHYLVLEFAHENDIFIGEDEFQATLAELQQEYSEVGFQEALLRGSANAAEWQRRLREQLLIQKVLQEVSADVEPPAFDEIKRYYDGHPDRYIRPRMLRFRQIVTRTEDEAQDLLERIQQGEDMGELARNHSVAPEAVQEGDVGWVARGQLEESMEEALFSLPEGKVSRVVKTPYGYHIFQVTGYKPEGTQELPDVIQEIESQLLREKQEAFCKEWLKELRDLFVVEVNEKLLEGT